MVSIRPSSLGLYIKIDCITWQAGRQPFGNCDTLQTDRLEPFACYGAVLYNALLQALVLHSKKRLLKQEHRKWVVSMADETDGKKLIKVVCVEDDSEMIDLVKLILGRQGFTVTGATGGREGLEAIAREQPDLVLLDLMMPDMDGWKVYQEMRADDEMRKIPVIVVTAKAQNIDKVLGLHIAKVDDYITKPFGPRELLTSVEKVLSQHGEA